MKKLINYTLLLAIAAIFMTACNMKSTPSETVKIAFDKMMQKDFDGVLDLYYDEEPMTKDQREAAKNLLTFAYNKVEQNYKGIKKIEITEETVSEDGQSATVKYIIHYGNGQSDDSTEKLVLKDNRWYLTR